MRILATRDGHARGQAREIAAPNVYGLELPPSEYGPRAVLKADGVSRGGNVIVHAGESNAPAIGWHKIGHVVLTPREARGLALELLAGAAIGEADTPTPVEEIARAMGAE